jgi:hypothetical protein
VGLVGTLHHGHAGIDQAQAHAHLQQDEGRLGARREGANSAPGGRPPVLRQESVTELAGEGIGAVHAGEMRAGHQGQTRMVAMHQADQQAGFAFDVAPM